MNRDLPATAGVAMQPSSSLLTANFFQVRPGSPTVVVAVVVEEIEPAVGVDRRRPERPAEPLLPDEIRRPRRRCS